AQTAVATSAATRPTTEAASVVVPDATNAVRAAAIRAERDRVMGSPAGGMRIPATVSAHPAAMAHPAMVHHATVGAPAARVLAATAPAQAPATVNAQVAAIGVPRVLLAMVRVLLVKVSVPVATAAQVLLVMVRVRLVMVSVPVVTVVRGLRVMVRVLLVKVSGLAATAAQVLRVMVRVRLVKGSVREATGAGREIAVVTDRLGMSRSVVGSTATRDVVGSAEIATASGRAAGGADVTRSCGRGKAAPHEVIGMRATTSVNSPKRSGWRGSCGPFGLGTTILTSPTTSNRATSTRVRGSS
ncbi:MAG TPA: hypothetical protein VGO99_03455, partial [Leifsonia sp.]|nr:hypothetical protein [Leifsonia sp.]